MARLLKDWLNSYTQYCGNTESAAIFHKWVGLSIVSSALQKKVWFKFGRFKIFPNLYIVLVAEPGVARKSVAISYGVRLLKEIPTVKISASSITKEALIDDMALAYQEAINVETQEKIQHCSMAVVSKEFESFIGQKRENTKMIVFLTDVYDAEDDLPWAHKTKHSGSSQIVGPYMTIVAATTPESLASSLPSNAVGGGFVTRVLFIWAGGRDTKVAIPEDLFGELTVKLQLDLAVISSLSGEFTFNPESKEWWIDWYNNRLEDDFTRRICKEKSFAGWYSRKHVHLLKIATCLSACRGNTKFVEIQDFERGLKLLEEMEKVMGNSFSALGRSEVSIEVDTVATIIESYGIITEHDLMALVWKDMDSIKFENVINTVIKRGLAVREFQRQPGSNSITIYKATAKKKG